MNLAVQNVTRLIYRKLLPFFILTMKYQKDNNPFKIISKNKYLAISLTKEVKDLYAENCKIKKNN